MKKIAWIVLSAALLAPGLALVATACEYRTPLTLSGPPQPPVPRVDGLQFFVGAFLAILGGLGLSRSARA